MLDISLDAAGEALLVGVDTLTLVPVGGLDIAGKVLLTIWQGIQAVETNRLSCLRLTERCANIYYSVREEINIAGPQIAETLREPVEKLTESFRGIEKFINKQVSRPFFKRYLKRDEDARRIIACDASLTDSVSLFSVAIQVRMLKGIRDLSLTEQHQPPVVIPAGTNEIIAAIAAIRSVQVARDSKQDMADLYTTMKMALRSDDDMVMLEVLQVDRSEIQEAIKTLQRALEDPRLALAGTKAHLAPVTPLQPMAPGDGPWDPDQEAAFHREFLEGGLDALRRLSGAKGGDESLPPWTITKWEVDREKKIGIGYFSDVYKGTWRGHTVAIKKVAESTPRDLFRREVSIWASMKKHTHVLELLGASSATGDPPWFFVSPYMKNGNLPTFLKAAVADKRRPEPLQMMQEIAVGMAHLHRTGVLHGDLKANNILIDDQLRCVISDFGQSESRSEVYRLSQTPKPPRGTVRWQAPELISGRSNLTAQADVYAFAIVCIEILTNGELPWQHWDDKDVKWLVLEHDMRPDIPGTPSPALVSLIERCWNRSPFSRPIFDIVASGLGKILEGLRGRITPSPQPQEGEQEESIIITSPDMAPVDLPGLFACYIDVDPGQDALGDVHAETPVPGFIVPRQRAVTPNADEHDPSRKNSQPSSGSSTQSSSEGAQNYEVWRRYASPVPREPQVDVRRDERRYRLHLQHDHHATLNLPLWQPCPVRIGAVGYLSKPHGNFVTLFNALTPSLAVDPRVRTMASIHGYGTVQEAHVSHIVRKNIAQISVQYIMGLLNFSSRGSGGDFSRDVKKRYSYPLRAKHKHAYLCTENTTYRYMVNIEAARTWFENHIKKILKYYGQEHALHREDVFLIIGTLETREYALFVSHEHPDGQVHFNVYADRREGQEWGIFSTDLQRSPSARAGPEYDDDLPNLSSVHTMKVSTVRTRPDEEVDAVLLAKLRFKPDEAKPTSR
ncbi:hypothetical protein BU17DRAFT_37976 [Hysterangium stoloniferum]|nr:hypothetical protein BU17DRAFT_37976 [Hysterangium stoloniferum]